MLIWKGAYHLWQGFATSPVFCKLTQQHHDQRSTDSMHFAELTHQSCLDTHPPLSLANHLANGVFIQDTAVQDLRIQDYNQSERRYRLASVFTRGIQIYG